MSLAEQLRAMAAQLEAGLTGGHELADAGEPEFDSADVCVKDYYVRDRVGCAKGALNRHYAEAHVMLGLNHGERPLHTWVVIPAAVQAPWMVATKSAADAGWNPKGVLYRPIPDNPAASIAAWYEAGCPYKNAGGVYDAQGFLMDPNAFVNQYRR